MAEERYAAEQLFALLDETGKPVTLDEHGQLTDSIPEDLIPLKDWAARNGISAATARQKALRGGLKTARKIGRDWMISAAELNPDNRMRLGGAPQPLLEGPVWFRQVMNALLKLNGSMLPDRWTQENAHRDYCKRLYFGLRSRMNGNQRILFDLLCEAMEEQKDSPVCFVSHAAIMNQMDDEAWYTANEDSSLNAGVTIDFPDYLVLLKNTVRDILQLQMELKIHHGTQDLFMPWYHSLSWREDREDGLYFVPSDFFKAIFFGLDPDQSRERE